MLPKSKAARIQWCQSHVAPWEANHAAIGTTAGAVTAFEAKTLAAKAAFEARTAAKQAAVAATNDLRLALAEMTDAASDIIKQVKAQAAIVGDGVYSLAQIPVPAQPSPIGPLAAASDFTVGLEVTGALNLTWKATQPKSATGVTYQIWRRIGHTGPFICLGGTGSKQFQDNTVPAGSPSVTYQIQATRSTSVSPWAQFVVNFGMDSSGTMIASVTQGTPVNLAA